jgi:hypothetical protein
MTGPDDSYEIHAAIDALAIGGRPLFVSDVDEVAVHFVRPFEAYLTRNGFWLDATSYGLTGNIKRADTHLAARKEEVHALIHGFFDAEIHRQETVEGVAEALGEIAALCDVVLLTNAPHRHRETRRMALAAVGLGYPVLTNDGPKGPALARLARRAVGPVFFIDDSPTNLASVRQTLPEAHVIHFVADPRFSRMAKPVPGTSLKTDRWPDVARYVQDVIAAP